MYTPSADTYMDLFSVEDVDIKILKDASKRICNIYGEIGGLGGRR